MIYIKTVSGLILPVVIIFVIMTGFIKKTDVFTEFSEGAKSALTVTLDIFPAVFTLMTGIGMLRSSGLLDYITDMISPFFKFINIPPEIVPAALLRPLSGSGSIALLSDILKSHGPDSLIGTMASVIIGSTETTFYTIAVYFGSVGVKNSGPAVKAALIADVASIITAIVICLMMF